MKKTAAYILILAGIFVLGGCQKAPEKTVAPISNSTGVTPLTPAILSVVQDEYTQELIARFDTQIKTGEITADQAKQKLQAALTELQKLNDGSVESILTKLELMDPVTAEAFRVRIKAHHPELFE